MHVTTTAPRTDRRPLLAGGAISFRPLALAYRVIALVLIVTGILRTTGILTGNPTWNALLYYTVLSNILCAVWMLLLALRTIQDLRSDGRYGTSTPSARFSGAVMEAITVTMLVYLFVLVPAAFSQPGTYEPFTLTDNLIHIITPCLLIADWLLFVRKGAFRWFEPLLWALIPYAYLVFAFTVTALGGQFGPGKKYAYPFMDVDALGIGGVATQILVLTIALVGVGYVYFGLDRLLHRMLSPSD